MTPDNVERRTAYFLVKRVRKRDGAETWFTEQVERKPSRKAALRAARKEKRLAENSRFSKPPVGVYRARQEVDLDEHYTTRGWGSKKKVALNPEEFPEIIEWLQDERETLLESWSEEEITEYTVDTGDGEVPITEYS